MLMKLKKIVENKSKYPNEKHTVLRYHRKL